MILQKQSLPIIHSVEDMPSRIEWMHRNMSNLKGICLYDVSKISLYWPWDIKPYIVKPQIHSGTSLE